MIILGRVTIGRLVLQAAVLIASLAFCHTSFGASWKQLEPLPNHLGVAGAFAGVTEGALVVAGGANFPSGLPWEGGRKAWHDDIFVLESPAGEWRAAGKLPHPLAYGVAASHKERMILIGGSDAREHHANAWSLRWNGKQCDVESLPELPEQCANMCGALLGDTVYLAGGTATPEATNALGTFLALNLSQSKPGWRSLEGWPGPARILATAGAHDGSVFLFGGGSLHAGPDGKPARQWLRDAYRFTPGQGWKRLADLPRVAVGAPSPSPVVQGKLLVIGGDDGSQVGTPPAEHRGFTRDILAYDPKRDRWETLSTIPFAHVTTPAVIWRNRIVIPSGEVRPGIRSPDVWTLDLE